MVENNQRDSWFLINVRLTDLLWMIRDSEKTGEKGSDPDLYRAALRYAVAMFSSTNAFNKYVRILADLAISFHCSSIWKQLFGMHLYSRNKQ